MRTPEEVVSAIDHLIGLSTNQEIKLEALLVEWRDECVEAKQAYILNLEGRIHRLKQKNAALSRKAGAPAGEDIAIICADTARLIADNCIDWDDQIFEAGRVRGIIKDALLTRAPLADSPAQPLHDASEWRAIAEAAEAERDRLSEENEALRKMYNLNHLALQDEMAENRMLKDKLRIIASYTGRDEGASVCKSIAENALRAKGGES